MNSSHNQQSTATKGGASSIPTPANSGGGGIFGGQSMGATHGKEGASGATGTTGNRRSSQEGSSLFNNLNTLKRNSGDQGVDARRTSMTDQAQKPGMIGSMWQKWTKGGE